MAEAVETKTDLRFTLWYRINDWGSFNEKSESPE